MANNTCICYKKNNLYLIHLSYTSITMMEWNEYKIIVTNACGRQHMMIKLDYIMGS